MKLSRLPLLLLIALALLPRDAHGQRAVSFRADNDAFNFWQSPWNRPDEEYSSGVRMTSEYAGRAPWAWWRAGRAASASCTDARIGCDGHSYAFGQDIYTAARTHAHPTPSAGARPDAGVLWFSAGDRWTRGNRISELRWTLGVTGKPSLAEPMQRFFHSLAPTWNRPIDWSHELPTEPVFALSDDERWSWPMGAMTVQPHAGASIGNLLTEARAGVGLQSGAWDAVSGVSHARPSVGLVLDATVRAVARNEVLSGTVFRPSEHVTLRTLVPELQGGVRARWRRLGVAFVVHQTGAEYEGRRTPHTWTTLQADWWPKVPPT